MAENQVQRFEYKMNWRHTRMGGRTENIAICEWCRTIINPIRVRYSRSGTHADEFYAHEHELAFLVLVQSNSGNRRHYVEGRVSENLKALLDEAGKQWSFYGDDTDKVVEFITRRL